LYERKMALADDLRSEFLFDALEARKAMYKILISPHAEDKDIINVAKDFLDRAGFKPQDKIEVSGSVDAGLEKLNSILSQVKKNE